MLLILAAPLHGAAADPTESNQGSALATSPLIQGKVTAIIDGDTLHLTAGNVIYLVDLAGIDAPEKGQPSGDMAAQVLHLKVMQKQVQLLVLPSLTTSPNIHPLIPVSTETPHSKPDSTRSLLRSRVRGILYSDGCVNWQLVHEGIAWHDPADCASARLAREQESARNARRGLWQSEQPPVSPWQWRLQQNKSAAGDAPATQGQPVKDLSRFFEVDTPPLVAEAAMPVQPPPTASPATVAPSSPSIGDYWLTTSSGIRHNNKCRYYKKSKGRPCTANEGQPCQKCGG